MFLDKAKVILYTSVVSTLSSVKKSAFELFDGILYRQGLEYWIFDVEYLLKFTKATATLILGVVE